MAIQFKCDSCGKTLKTDDSKAGKRVKCPGCAEVITIPQLQIQEEDEEDEMEDEEEEEDFAPKRKSKSSGRRRQSSSSGGDLAPVWKRFVGSIADNFATLLFIGPGYAILVFGAIQADQRHNSDVPMGVLLGLLLMVVGGMAVLGINIFLYSTRSQSIGKWLLGMQVMDYETDRPAGVGKAFFLRGFLCTFLQFIPLLGGIFGLIDAVMIFGEERRCLHDQIAGTYVIDM